MKQQGKYLLFFIGLVGGLSINETKVVASTQSTPTKGEIYFVPNTKPTPPIDPLKPDVNDPIAVDEEESIGTSGPLTIDFVSNLYFGRQTITSQDETYYARPQHYRTSGGEKIEGPNFIQVTDNRGTEAGWTLYLKQNEQFKTKEGQELIGASISLKNGEVVSVSDSPAPIGSKELQLMPNGEQVRVMYAQADSGAGTNLLSWGNNVNSALQSIELTVPGKAIKYSKYYSTTFTWTLSDVPSN